MLFWTVIGTFIFSLLGLLTFVLYHRKGQFEDSEEVKYQVFRE